MATLTNTKVKDTYNQLLKTVAGQIGGGFSVVEDGLGNSSGLGLSTSGVGVTKLTFINSPATATTEYLGLFLNSSNEVVQRELAVSAFTQPSLIGGTGVYVSGNYTSFTITNTAPEQTVSFTGTDISIGGAYPNFTLVNTAPDQVVSISGGQDINVTGTYPSFTINHALGTISAIATDSGIPAQVAIVSANMGVRFEGGTGIETIADDASKKVTFVNTAPDQVVSITGTNDATVTGTYPNFNIDVVAGSGSGVHEEMIVGRPESEYILAPNSGQIVAFSNPDNASEETSYHFGTAPAKLALVTGNSEIENVSGSKVVVYIDIVTGRNKRKSLGSSPPPKQPGARIQTSVRKKKATRNRRAKWVADTQNKLTKLRLDSTITHTRIHASILASKGGTKKVSSDYRGRCILCCGECSRPNPPRHESPWGFKTARACDVCGEYLCTNEKKARWDGRTCWDVWHQDEKLPEFPCKSNK